LGNKNVSLTKETAKMAAAAIVQSTTDEDVVRAQELVDDMEKRGLTIYTIDPWNSRATIYEMGSILSQKWDKVKLENPRANQWYYVVSGRKNGARKRTSKNGHPEIASTPLPFQR
jgi:hypothetical protein